MQGGVHDAQLIKNIESSENKITTHES